MYFHAVRKKYHQYESDFTGVDTRVQVNQVPGGMVSNLANQLKEQGALHRINEAFNEIPKVRKDPHPPLVTPTSQIVGMQAVFNVLAGERYKTITNEVKLYLQGRYGKSPAPVDAALQHQAIGNEEVIDVRPADLLKPELEKLRAEVGGALAKSEEDVRTTPCSRILAVNSSPTRSRHTNPRSLVTNSWYRRGTTSRERRHADRICD